MSESAVANAIVAKLAVHLGPHVAKVALRTFAKKIAVADDHLTAADVPGLIREMRPMLNVMIGKGPSEVVVADLERLAIAK
jgi:hypothetical protein